MSMRYPPVDTTAARAALESASAPDAYVTWCLHYAGRLVEEVERGRQRLASVVAINDALLADIADLRKELAAAKEHPE